MKDVVRSRAFKYSILIWAFLSVCYTTSLKMSILINQWDYLIYIIQIVFDFLIGWYGFYSYKNAQIKIDKQFYLLLLMSIVPGLLTNEIYNIVVHIFNIKYTVPSPINYWSISYLIFLLLHMSAWFYLYYSQFILNDNLKINILLLLTSTSLCFLLLIFLIYLFFGKNSLLAINSLIEIIIYVLLILNLSRTKSASLIIVETGFLVLIASNLAHRFSDFTSQYFKFYDIIWFLTLIIITFGLKQSSIINGNRISFYHKKSIHTHICQIFILISCVLIFMLVGIWVGFDLLGTQQNFLQLKNILIYLPSAVILTTTIAVLLVKKIANYITQPFDRMLNNILTIRDQKENDLYDISYFHEIKETEQIMLNTISDLQKANSVKSDFLMNMSHDFRTPTSGIRHLSRLIYEKLDDLELKSMQKLVVDSANQLMNFIEAILDYMKLENADNFNNAYLFDVKQLIDELTCFYQAKLHEKSLKLNIEFADDKLSYFGDRQWIYRILMNIFSNAIKYTHTGSISINITKDDQWLKISIRDTGIGIPKKNHNLIFEPFFRGTSSDLAEYPGIGLGLSTSKFLISKLNGLITFESTVNVGSCFYIHLPV